MWSSHEIPWLKINDFLLNAEKPAEPKSFSEQIIRKIYSLIPYDQARVYFVNGNDKVYDQILLEVDQQWDVAYLQYFSKLDNGRYSLAQRMEDSNPILGVDGGVINWNKKKTDEFLEHYIKPQGLSSSVGFRLKDSDNTTKSIFCLDRIGNCNFSQNEIEIVRKVYPHLENLFKHVTILGSIFSQTKTSELEKVLTGREYEIVDLLSKGMSPIKIAKKCGISLQTVYKHIANIYAKLQISSRQELMIKVYETGGAR
jgi:DNA-binding CsgD family transcriptional regulator